MRHVILGNGPAGVIAAETIRRHAPTDSITLIGDESGPPYSRMAIPYLLRGAITEAGMHLRKEPDHFMRLDIALRPGKATVVDTVRQNVLLDDGAFVPYDRLLIATGATPLRPPIPGIDLPCVQNCWTLGDARRIMAMAQPGARVLQIGAGFIGCIILEALAARGVRLSVVEMADRMVPRMMGPAAGGMIRDWVERQGIAVHTSTGVEAIERDAPFAVVLSTGERVPVDLVICAAGVRPNIGFLQDSPIRCLQGVLTDEHMQTTVAGVYAAGDCAEAFDVASGKTIVSAIQPNAADQGYCAGMNMAGRRAQLPGVTQINVLDTLGLVSTSFGQWQGIPGGDHAELTDAANFRHIRLEFDGDVLVGSNAIGLTDHVGVLRGLTQSRVALGKWKDELLRNPLRVMEAYLASAQAQQSRGARVD